jgi:hypothetical protein
METTSTSADYDYKGGCYVDLACIIENDDEYQHGHGHGHKHE